MSRAAATAVLALGTSGSGSGTRGGQIGPRRCLASLGKRDRLEERGSKQGSRAPASTRSAPDGDPPQGDAYEMELLVVAGATLVALIPLFVLPSRWVVHVARTAMVAQVGLVVSAWGLLAALPEKSNQRNPDQTCPIVESAPGEALEVVAFCSIGVGAFALAAAILSAARRASSPWRVLAGLATAGLALAIWMPFYLAPLCGSS